MSVDYIVSSLPTLSFDAPAPISWEKFTEFSGYSAPPSAWTDLEAQLRNAIAEARRGTSDFNRPTKGCSLFWKNRIAACFREKDVAQRELLIDKVWWDAAGELTTPASPLGKGALDAYAVRLKISIKRSMISKEAGNAAFDKATSGTKVSFPTNKQEESL